MQDESQEGLPEVAGVIAPPPLIFAGFLAATIALERFACARPLPPQLRFVAPGFAAAAAFIGPPAFRIMRSAGTNVNPYRATTAIVQSGPFAVTRNPLYLSMALLYAAIALAARARFPFFAIPALLWLVETGVIEREERYLETKFGPDYSAYKLQVPRWL